MATWLTLEEAAKHLKIGKSTLYRLAREGELPAHRMGRVWRFDAEELDKWLKTGKDTANTVDKVSNDKNKALSAVNEVRKTKNEA